MNLYQRLGYLVLGSRLRRLSETFISEVVRAYQQLGIAFEAAWFPVFYLLSTQGELSIKELSDQTEVSHPAASQLVATLKKKGLVKVKTSKTDGRKQIVTLTIQGRELLAQVQPVWKAIPAAMEELTGQHDTQQLFDTLGVLENTFQQTVLSDMIVAQFNHAEHE